MIPAAMGFLALFATCYLAVFAVQLHRDSKIASPDTAADGPPHHQCRTSDAPDPTQSAVNRGAALSVPSRGQSGRGTLSLLREFEVGS